MIEFSLADAAASLERTPMVLRAMLGGLPERWAHAPEPDGWSVFDVAGHLIHGEEADWIPRARIILEHGEARAFEPFDREAMFEASRGRTLDELLDRFAELRSEGLAALASMGLTEADLDRRGTHPVFGAATLRQLLATWVTHDQTHIAQIARILARQYRDEVGPWSAYIGVLRG